MTLRLHYNENIAGCSPAVLRALSALTVNDIARYDSDARATVAIAEWLGASSDCVLPVNGLDEGLLLAAQLAAVESPPRYEALIVEPAFEMYEHVINATGGRVVRVLPADEFEFSVNRVLAAATGNTRLVFLCNPNNPTGASIAVHDIERIADALTRSLIFVDEAYADFSGRTIVGTPLASRPNIIVGRTFSKAHGLAGLRVGALVAARGTVDQLRRLALPYRINVAALLALEASLSDRDHFIRTIAEAVESRERLANACGRLGWQTWPSEGNFLLVRIGKDAERCAAWLSARGVLVRDRSRLPGCDGCLRITTGTVASTAIVISLLEEWHDDECR